MLQIQLFNKYLLVTHEIVTNLVTEWAVKPGHIQHDKFSWFVDTLTRLRIQYLLKIITFYI